LALTSEPVVDVALLLDPPLVPAWTGAFALTRLDCDPLELPPDPAPFDAPLDPACTGAVALTSDPVVAEPEPLDPPLDPTCTGAVALTRLDCDPPLELPPDPPPLDAPLFPAWTGAVALTSEPPCAAVGPLPGLLADDPAPGDPGWAAFWVAWDAAVGPVDDGDAAVGLAAPGFPCAATEDP
jgi:hypothetical protein